jgi:hypothetical protein
MPQGSKKLLLLFAAVHNAQRGYSRRRSQGAAENKHTTDKTLSQLQSISAKERERKKRGEIYTFITFLGVAPDAAALYISPRR